MNIQYISDCHIHTDCSPDGTDSAMMMCESAARLGFYAVTITDHCECNHYRTDGYDKSIRQSCFESRKAAAAFQGRLHVFSGVELGQPMQNTDAAEDALGCFNYDFVLASLHNITGKKDFFDLDYSAENIDDLLNRYFDEILEMIEWGKFDSLAHLTYPWRYLAGEFGLHIHTDRFMGRIDEVIKTLIAKNIALEVNTSGFRQRLGTSMPDAPVIRRYRELGGRMITLGSDAHRWADVGGGIELGLKLIRSAGFHHYVVFTGRKPHYLPVE
ncbi:histidinol-phosphatase HisJ family protein [Caproicibacter fermentans]|uniref:Histidinol-phosphatase n=1 Tax=Caproicibacter fermentans TaxID=2576756 RepID=A0A7G8TBX2_9FIRM|nr:histidinol-phosphatase HisJ family protein [Caproicibacter fermentans]QNK41113.1 histidinol-phosphatase HisJ family protein [Caproicibacter fermentans]